MAKVTITIEDLPAVGEFAKGKLPVGIYVVSDPPMPKDSTKVTMAQLAAFGMWQFIREAADHETTIKREVVKANAS